MLEVGVQVTKCVSGDEVKRDMQTEGEVWGVGYDSDEPGYVQISVENVLVFVQLRMNVRIRIGEKDRRRVDVTDVASDLDWIVLLFLHSVPYLLSQLEI